MQDPAGHGLDAAPGYLDAAEGDLDVRLDAAFDLDVHLDRDRDLDSAAPLVVSEEGKQSQSGGRNYVIGELDQGDTDAVSGADPDADGDGAPGQLCRRLGMGGGPHKKRAEERAGGEQARDCWWPKVYSL